MLADACCCCRPAWLHCSMRMTWPSSLADMRVLSCMAWETCRASGCLVCACRCTTPALSPSACQQNTFCTREAESCFSAAAAFLASCTQGAHIRYAYETCQAVHATGWPSAGPAAHPGEKDVFEGLVR